MKIFVINDLFFLKTCLYKNHYILKSTCNLIMSINMKILNKTIISITFESIKQFKKYQNNVFIKYVVMVCFR